MAHCNIHGNEVSEKLERKDGRPPQPNVGITFDEAMRMNYRNDLESGQPD